jgi:hypothetical protein
MPGAIKGDGLLQAQLGGTTVWNDTSKSTAGYNTADWKHTIAHEFIHISHMREGILNGRSRYSTLAGSEWKAYGWNKAHINIFGKTNRITADWAATHQNSWASKRECDWMPWQCTPQ